MNNRSGILFHEVEGIGRFMFTGADMVEAAKMVDNYGIAHMIDDISDSIGNSVRKLYPDISHMDIMAFWCDINRPVSGFDY